MDFGKVARVLTRLAVLSRDVNAVQRGRVGERVANRLIGRVVGRGAARLWR